ncbi:MAG: hypothetical protein JWQ89_2350 [Devosia sp.]|uniref:DUF707 domain-containing protein n=1 Tax=Devosia sp. TaxID=1871048 RepID=UPI002636E163|nr:DUF707 domain-containing protein [Devosia sp.]MDB5540623.1 hypothetical protein [Devosia sp.]
MSTPTRRRFAVIVRAGENSLHRTWLKGQARNWDLIVSWYGTTPYVASADETVLEQRGLKWDVVAAQLRDHPEIVARYDYLIIGDDDVDISVETINRLFEISEQEGLQLSQPGLTANSYFSAIHHLQSPSFRLRYTPYVEVMFPCLSRAALTRILPYAGDSPSGSGLDLIWARLEPDNRFRAAIVDTLAMRHTRPVGSVLAGKVKEAGHDNAAIVGAMLARFGIVWGRRQFFCYAGITRSGRRVGPFGTRWRMAWDSLRRLREWPVPRRLGKWWVLYCKSHSLVPVTELRSRYEGPLRLDERG